MKAVDMHPGQCRVHHNKSEPWRVTLGDTGEQTQTGGRLKRIAPHLENDENFWATHGDGVSDVDIAGSIAFRSQYGKQATVTAVRAFVAGH